MPDCPTCSRPFTADASFCSSCGSVVGSVEALETVAPRAPSAPSPSPSASSAVHPPGTMLLNRYRIVGPVGRGGMGDVYRADDLKLGQAVALKFLHDHAERDPKALERLLKEVRLARQIAHPAVCRVYDVAEVDGRHFISMEYVDGEDLASLLRRIGRLPPDKAIQIARQLCGGLAAAHDRGILHRDLKPANVMLDGRGQVRITDFGLAGLTDDHGGDRAGTPAYMAPEQLRDNKVSVRSDIYALGLVLYEIFTGKRAVDVNNPVDVLRAHDSEDGVPTPSSVRPDIDPTVEAVILRTLERDPAARPASALAVAAALPGGNPLAQALAAGETPSPELVAAAGDVREVPARHCWLGLLALVSLSACLVALAPRTLLVNRSGVRKPPQVLAERAREVLRLVGRNETPTDSANGFVRNGSYLRHMMTDIDPARRWQDLDRRPPTILFWYRESPRHLESADLTSPSFGRVTERLPAMDVSGMSHVRLDPSGRLRELRVVPDQTVPDQTVPDQTVPDRTVPDQTVPDQTVPDQTVPDQTVPDRTVPPTTEPDAVDWSVLFDASGLDIGKFVPTESRWIPPDFADLRMAWLGVYPDNPDVPLRVEAAAYDGHPTYFQLIEPWTDATRMNDIQPLPGARVAQVVGLLLTAAILLGGTLLARRNLQRGRGDRRGAARVAVTMAALNMIAWLCIADHVPTTSEWTMFFGALAFVVLNGAFLWTFYIALEPTVRRRWPERLVSWSRLLVGRVRDPLVGRDVLVGLAVGALLRLLSQLRGPISTALGLAPVRPASVELDLLLGFRFVLANILAIPLVAVFTGLSVVVFLVLLRMLLRSNVAATLVFAVILGALTMLQLGGNPVVDGVLSLILIGLWLLLLSRFGLLALVACLVANSVLSQSPLTTDLRLWYALPGLTMPLAVLVVGVAAFVTALGGRPIVRLNAFDD